jgi:hypothetical protein
MEAKKLKAESKGEVVNEKQIYLEVTGPPTHVLVLGTDASTEPIDVYGITSSSQGCREGWHESHLKDKEEFKARLK